MPEVHHGEVWRLVSPIIIHFGFAHILFNMMWLRDLGSMFEARLGWWYFLIFVVVIAAVSNYAEYVLKHTANFGGMSGVIYGLIGYVAVRGRFDPSAGLSLDRQSVVWALIWFVACFTGWVGPIANTVHAVGLCIGAAWGFVDAKLKSQP
jgi:GlpG protein